MSLPVVSSLASNPIGWAIIGVAGVLSYTAGKKTGLKDTDDIEKPCLGDRAVKGVMKTFYRTKKKVGESLSKSSDKYSEIWAQAQTEVKAEK